MPEELEEHVRSFLIDKLGISVFYQHLNRKQDNEFAWFLRNGDETEDTLDGDGSPDTVYFDLEVYTDDVDTLPTLCGKLRGLSDYRGLLRVDSPESYVDDLEIRDQSDDYEPRANADSLPAYSASFRMMATGFGEA